MTLHDFSASPTSFSAITELQRWEKVPHFLVYITVFSLVFVKQIDLNRLEKILRMIKSLILTYMKDLADFSASPISFWTTTEPETWGKVPYFLVHIAVFSPYFCQTNRPEPARKVIQNDKVTHTNLYEGPGMIFQPLLPRFGLKQSFRHGKKYLIS